MAKDVEADQVGFKLQRLWSGLRKRWSDSTAVSKRPELQELKDKMRPCYRDQAGSQEGAGSNSEDELFALMPLECL